MIQENRSIFRQPMWAALFALTAAIAWGWAYPLIKQGFTEFGITETMTGSKILFAGIRFTISGLIILAIALATRRNFKIRKSSDWWYILLFSLLNTTLHYAFFYIGLSHSAGARAAILNSMSVFTLVLLACLFFKSERLTTGKIAGCTIGFIGILTLNIGGAGETDAHFTIQGDGMIILNALCSAFAGLMTRGVNKRMDVFVGTGYSLAIGGILLVITGACCNGNLPIVTKEGIIILVLLICISALGFALYNKLLTCNPMGKVAIFNSLIPAVGALTSCLYLNEPFHIKYIAALLMATTGIIIINREKGKG